MHGRKRTQREELDPPEVRAAKVEKYKQYLSACKAALQSDESAQRAEKVLRYNPDFFTLWNSRRRMILDEFAKVKSTMDPDAVKEFARTTLLKELSLTKDQIAERNSKSYGAWFHRRWAIETLAWYNDELLLNFNDELALCDALLTRDERNFHCWAHRDFIAGLANVTTADDFAKSTALISKNFSNYSAWHLRVQAIIRGEKDFVDWAKEFDLIHQAIFTEPADQSAWLYFRWLLTLEGAVDEARIEEELSTIRSLLEEEGECKWPLLAIIQLLAKLDFTPERQKEAMDVCQRLQRVDHFHTNYYIYISTMFELCDFDRLKKALFMTAKA